MIAVVYESRPNVTVDAAALCLKAGNGVFLRGGSEAIYSNLALAKVLKDAMQASGVDPNALQVVPMTDREAVNVLLGLEEHIDLTFCSQPCGGGQG